MKKLIATSLCLGLLGTAALAQGLITGVNAASTDIYTSSNGVATLTGGSATASYDYELLTAPSTLPTGSLGYAQVGGSLAALLAGPWSDTGITFSNSGLAGRASMALSTAAFWPIGNAQDFVVVGWSANLGSWANVAADLAVASLSTPTSGTGLQWVASSLQNGQLGGYIGATVVGNVVSGSSGEGPSIFGTVVTGSSAINTTTALYAVIVPEPTTFALAGLSAAAMLIFRRRK